MAEELVNGGRDEADRGKVPLVDRCVGGAEVPGGAGGVVVGGQAVGEEEVFGAEGGADVVVLWMNVRTVLV